MSYPVTLNIEYPDRLSRLTTFFRLFMLIPQVFVYAFVSIAAEIILILSWFAILFTGKYPETFLNFITWWLRWYARLTGYAYLLTDRYPPFSGRVTADYPIILEVEPPGQLSRLTTFLRLPISPTWTWAPSADTLSKWAWQWSSTTPGIPMTIPHLIVLYFIGIAGGILLFLCWWAIIFTG